MQTLERTKDRSDPILPEHLGPEHIAVAFLVQRFQEMPAEAFADIVSLAKQWTDPSTPREYRGEIFETIREILFPELVGGIRFGRAGSTEEMPEKLLRRANHVGSTIKRIREGRGLTQTQLARETGLPQPHISRLESGAHSPSMKTMEKIAKALGVAVGDLDPSH